MFVLPILGVCDEPPKIAGYWRTSVSEDIVRANLLHDLGRWRVSDGGKLREPTAQEIAEKLESSMGARLKKEQLRSKFMLTYIG